MMRAIQGVVDEYESHQIGVRTRSRMLEAIRRKGYITGGTPLFGYDKKTDPNGFTRLAPNKDFKKVRYIFELAAEGMGNVNISKTLEKKKIFKYKKIITKKTVENILSNVTYTGGIYWGEPRELIHEDAHPAAVSMETWLSIQEQKKERATKQSIYGRNPEYLLTSKIVCGTCGTRMLGTSGNRNGKKYRYYTCGKKEKHKSCPQKICVPIIWSVSRAT